MQQGGNPPPQPPQPPAPQPVPPVPVQNAGTFVELFSSLPDLLDGTYNPYLAPFDAADPTTPGQLRDRLVRANEEVPKVVLCMPTNDPPVIKVLHTPFNCPPTLGRPSPWDNQLFIFGSDIGVGNQYSLVNFSNFVFHQSPNVRVATAATMDNQWTAAAGADCVGPFTAADADTEDKVVRNSIVVPPVYIAHVMERFEWTPHALWDRLYPLLVADNRVVDCAPLLDWLRVACTYRPPAAGAQVPDLPAVHGLALTAPVTDASLQRRAWEKVVSMLPSLQERTGSATVAYTDALAALQTEFAAQRQDQAARAAAAAAPVTYGEEFPQLATLLCRVCEVATPAQLPPLWNVVANSKKTERVAAVQSWMDDRAVQDGASGVSPIITPELYQILATGKLSSDDLDDLTLGLSPFNVAKTYGSAATDSRARAHTYTMLYSGLGAPQLQDIVAVTKSTPNIPTTTLGYMTQSKGYATLLDGVLGTEHRVAQSFRDVFLKNLATSVLSIDDEFGHNVSAIIPLLLRYVQLEMAIWMQDAIILGANATEPKFHGLIDLIRKRQFGQLPTLPSRYLEEVPDTGSGTPPGGDDGKKRNRGDENSKPEANSSANQVPRLVKRFKAHGQPLKVLTTNNDANIPKADDGGDLCMSFHLKCSCWDTCKRRGTHRKLSKPEEDRVDAFMDKCNVPKI